MATTEVRGTTASYIWQQTTKFVHMTREHQDLVTEI